MSAEAIIYFSTATAELNSTCMTKLVNKASMTNKLLEITGYLYFEKNIFFQYLEGPQAKLSLLFNTIRQDKRHSIATFTKRILPEGKRRFPDWHMNRIKNNFTTAIGFEELISSHLKLMDKHQNLMTSDLEESTWKIVDSFSEFICKRRKQPTNRIS